MCTELWNCVGDTGAVRRVASVSRMAWSTAPSPLQLANTLRSVAGDEARHLRRLLRHRQREPAAGAGAPPLGRPPGSSARGTSMGFGIGRGAGQHRARLPPSRAGPGRADADAGDEGVASARLPQDQAAIDAAEAERVADHRRPDAARSGSSPPRRRGRPDPRTRHPGSPAPCRRGSQIAAIATSTIPAAPSVCPVQPLVELHGVASPNTAAHRAVLHRVVRPRAGAVQVHVVDLRRREPGRGQRRAHGRRSRRRPRDAAPTCGSRRCWRRSRAARRPSPAAAPGRSSSAKPAASPIEMPVARRVARSARAGRDQFQRREAVQRHAAQAVRPAHHGGVAHAGLDQMRARRRRRAAETRRRWRRRTPARAGPAPPARSARARPCRACAS